MPKFFFTTDNGRTVDIDDEGVELPDHVAAREEAKNALADIVREQLPNREHADFEVDVRDEAGNEIYLASIKFEACNPREKADRDARAFNRASDMIAASVKRMK